MGLSIMLFSSSCFFSPQQNLPSSSVCKGNTFIKIKEPELEVDIFCLHAAALEEDAD